MSNITQIEVGEHIKESYMPYAMGTIIDRALPDVRDGLKPVARRLLYKMYDDGMTYNKDRFKTSEPISATMTIHHHGDASIAEALALMTEQNESLLHPFIDGEGAFGKVYSNDPYSAPRYTYCRMNYFAEELLHDVKKGIVPMIGEDEKHLQPLVLSANFPLILIKNNSGIACAQKCEFPSFNLVEVCNTTIEYIKNKNINLIEHLTAPDFSTGGFLIYNKDELEKIYDTGKGSVRLRAKYSYDKENNCIDIHEIPYNTKVETIINKICDLIKKPNDFKECKNILDVRDETGFNQKTQKEEMKITIDVKKNTDIESLMKILFNKTPLETSYHLIMNCLVDYNPKVLGIKGILNEWLKFRFECIIKSIEIDIKEKNEKLHLLKGLEKILLNTDKAVQIIRYCEEDKLIQKLCDEFKTDKIQSEHVSNLKLRNINHNYILKQIKIIKDLENEIIELENTKSDKNKINKIIINELERIKKEYGKPRRTQIIYEDNLPQIKEEEIIEDYSTTLILTKEQYFKKTKKYSEKQTLKDGDEILQIIQSSNKNDLLLFTNKGKVFTRKLNDINDCTPSQHGEYIPNLLKNHINKDEEKIIYMISPESYDKGHILFIYEDGTMAKTPLSSYKTSHKSITSKAQKAYNTEHNIKYIQYIEKDIDMLCLTSEGKALIFNTEQINPKSTKTSFGNPFIKLNSPKFENNTLVDIIFNPTEETILKFKTTKKELLEFKLSDIAEQSKDKISYLEYLKGNKNSTGNFIYNCRQKNDRIIELIK